jgi:hypothetical protein
VAAAPTQRGKETPSKTKPGKKSNKKDAKSAKKALVIASSAELDIFHQEEVGALTTAKHAICLHLLLSSVMAALLLGWWLKHRSSCDVALAIAGYAASLLFSALSIYAQSAVDIRQRQRAWREHQWAKGRRLEEGTSAPRHVAASKLSRKATRSATCLLCMCLLLPSAVSLWGAGWVFDSHRQHGFARAQCPSALFRFCFAAMVVAVVAPPQVIFYTASWWVAHRKPRPR